MSRAAASVSENSFIKGYVTEYTGLNFPENAVTEAFDCTFLKTGKVTRRLGLDFEEGYTKRSHTRSNSEISEFVWENPGGDSSLTFVVSQVGATIYFYEVASTSAVSTTRRSETVVLTSYLGAPSNPSPGLVPCQYASGNGYLLIVNQWTYPIKVEYNPTSDVISKESFQLKIRDTEGIYDSNPVNDYRGQLTTDHRYNLRNQGWTGDIYCVTQVFSDGSKEVVNANPLEVYYNVWGYYPSDAEQYWTFKDEDGQFYPLKARDYALPTTGAPKGHFIGNAMFFDRANIGGAPGAGVVTSSGYGPSTVAFFAGRAWYAGINKDNYTQKIYFSQIIQTKYDLGLCYQQNDPTSELASELLPSDGGVLIIPEMGKVERLFVSGVSLLVFTSNGIWAIQGSQDIGFTATDFTVRRISSVSVQSGRSFVNVEGTPFWVNHDGIWSLTAGENGSASVISLSDKTIKTFWTNLPNANKNYVKGAYNTLDKVIQWVYKETSTENFDEKLNYSHILNLNTETGAFYIWRINSLTNVYLNGIISVRSLGTTRITETITDAGIAVTTGGSNITVTGYSSIPVSSVFKYIVSENTLGSAYDVTFAEEYDDTYADWTSSAQGDQDYESYFITGYKVHTEGQRKFQINYLFTFLEQETDSSCFVQGIWDYATSNTTGRFTQFQQVYGTRDNRSYQLTKRRIRGQGYSLQFKFKSASGKPFNLIGWTAYETGNSLP